MFFDVFIPRSVKSCFNLSATHIEFSFKIFTIHMRYKLQQLNREYYRENRFL